MACDPWRANLSCEWGASIARRCSIEIKKPFYNQMYAACTEYQKKVFDEIFGSPEPKWTIKDAKDGEPVWCKNSMTGVWELKYANGIGGVYLGQKKSGSSWYGNIECMKFDPDNLPVNEDQCL
jgi:hypothetical protein